MTDREPLVRRAARVIVLDGHERVLLIHGHDPARPGEPWWWITPGGGVEGSESLEAAARREVREETGLELAESALGSAVLRRTVTFDFAELLVEQRETFFLVHVAAPPSLDRSGWNDLERSALSELRWWTLPELAATSELVFPEGLLDLLRDNGIGLDLARRSSTGGADR